MQATEVHALIADDDPHIRDVMARVLEAAGYGVLLAGEGDEALDVAYHALPNLVLMNTDLRGQSGWLVCAKLKLGRPAPTVLLYTSRQDGPNRDYAAYAGAEAIFEHADDTEGLALQVGACIERCYGTLCAPVARRAS